MEETVIPFSKVVEWWQRYTPALLGQLGLHYPFLVIESKPILGNPEACASSNWAPSEGAAHLEVSEAFSWSSVPAARSNDWWQVLMHEIAHQWWAEARGDNLLNSLVEGDNIRDALGQSTEDVINCIARSLMHIFPRPNVDGR